MSEKIGEMVDRLINTGKIIEENNWLKKKPLE